MIDEEKFQWNLKTFTFQREKKSRSRHIKQASMERFSLKSSSNLDIRWVITSFFGYFSESLSMEKNYEFVGCKLHNSQLVVMRYYIYARWAVRAFLVLLQTRQIFIEIFTPRQLLVSESELASKNFQKRFSESSWVDIFNQKKNIPKDNQLFHTSMNDLI